MSPDAIDDDNLIAEFAKVPTFARDKRKKPVATQPAAPQTSAPGAAAPGLDNNGAYTIAFDPEEF